MLWRLDVITVHAIWPEPVWNINVFTSLPSPLLQIRAQSAEKLSECLSKSGQTDNTVTTRAIKKSHNSNYTSIVSQMVFSCPTDLSSSGRPIIRQTNNYNSDPDYPLLIQCQIILQ